jgi:hypothetical protein
VAQRHETMTRNLARVWGVITLVSGCEKKPAAEPLSERECIVEFFLFMGLFATRPVRRVLLCLGIGLHLAIMLFMGLTQFLGNRVRRADPLSAPHG